MFCACFRGGRVMDNLPTGGVQGRLQAHGRARKSLVASHRSRQPARRAVYPQVGRRIKPPSDAHELCHVRVGADFLQLGFRRSAGSVTVALDQAQKSQMVVPVGSELVPGHGRDV